MRGGTFATARRVELVPAAAGPRPTAGPAHALLVLQRQAGNAAVVARVANTGPSVQRKAGTTGLRAASHLAKLSDRWVSLWSTTTVSSVGDLVKAMGITLNQELRTLGVPEPAVVPDDKGTEGGFRRQEWRIKVNVPLILAGKAKAEDKANTLAVEQVADLGETMYHEGRHAEQVFLGARAKTAKVPDPAALATTLEIPGWVASAAVKAGKPGRKDVPADEIEGWASFDPSGRHFEYWKWNEVLKTVTASTLEPVLAKPSTTLDEHAAVAKDLDLKLLLLGTNWAVLYKAAADLARSPKLTPVDAGVQAELTKILAAFDELRTSVAELGTAVAAWRAEASKPGGGDPSIVRLEVGAKRSAVRVAQLQLLVIQGDAYTKYPHEADAFAAGAAMEAAIKARGSKAKAKAKP